MNVIKRAGNFLCSMKFAIILLLVLIAACTAGSLIPQGEVSSWYTSAYPGQLSYAILLFGLDDVFHCPWFVVLTLFLCANLLGCNVLRFPALYRRTRTGFDGEKRLKSWNGKAVLTMDSAPDALFAAMGFRSVESGTVPAGEYRYAVRNKAGLWGAWLCHLGMLIVIAGFGFGQMLKQEYTVYGVPGQTKPVGDTGYELTIDSFDISLREDETVEQYTAGLTMTDASGAAKSGEASVNSPLSLFGMKLYQNSTGWAATADVYKGEEKLQEALLCAGEYALIKGQEELAVSLTAFYPDYVASPEDGRPMTASGELNNPGYLYTLYYQNQVLGMNVLTGDDKITVEDYTIVFRDPQQYTLIQVKRDPFGWLAAIGGVTVLAALILAFYLRTAELWAVLGEDGLWHIAGSSRKGGALFLEELVTRGLACGAVRREQDAAKTGNGEDEKNEQ